MKKYKKYALGLIIISVVIKLLLAASVELGNDEVYYWTYALHLQWNYFDHPPMVGWLIRLTTLNLFFHQEVFVRLGAIVASAASTWMIFKTGSLIRDEKTGWYAALLFTASIYSSVIAGLFILPDSPQLFFWLWAIYLLCKITLLTPGDKQARLLWVLFGLAAGLCMMCKVHGVFVWAGAGLYILLFERQWLKNLWIYVAVLISLLIISPVIIWNFENHFITYLYHSGRVSLRGMPLNFNAFIREFLGQVAYNNPVNFVLVSLSVWTCVSAKECKPYVRMLLCCSLPLIFTLLIISTFRDTLPHWSGPAYSTLLLLAAIRLAENPKFSAYQIPVSIKSGLIVLLVFMFGGLAAVNFYPGTISNDKELPGKGDATLDMYGWKKFGHQMDSLYRSDKALGKMGPKARIIVTEWFPAAHIDFYVAQKGGLSTYAKGYMFDLHQYVWTNTLKPPLKIGEDAYFIQPSNLFRPEALTYLQKRFKEIEAPDTVSEYRNGALCRQFFVYRLRGYLGK
ncbi:MAG TPA: glycosyltransferase family 39 protein [Daejeonella sp.]|nr:glycosyltransferase family 39 protein [Daejeonella sp.]